MALTQAAATRAYVLVAAVLAAALLLAAVISVAYLAAPVDPCSPEGRQAAIEQDVQLQLAGTISKYETVDREVARIEACE